MSYTHRLYIRTPEEPKKEEEVEEEKEAEEGEENRTRRWLESKGISIYPAATEWKRAGCIVYWLMRESGNSATASHHKQSHGNGQRHRKAERRR
ncbi:hypothetical protein EYF80_019581 [Liparis tanakae]|uniref:Uncharacterized protein n=1 Tax=Liparis tanakae TaxID=230148 RepID=A0A4Z2HXE2_9TELE|nr:hypothetical protein EYF80_019581 [Liparis tanakae]